MIRTSLIMDTHLWDFVRLQMIAHAGRHQFPQVGPLTYPRQRHRRHLALMLLLQVQLPVRSVVVVRVRRRVAAGRMIAVPRIDAAVLVWAVTGFVRAW